ncbi:type II toxin-antitoxin system VapC family toxin [Kamptonema formosum]|nr:PIN domain-containing protein [Kamptonema formosum]
MKILLDTNVIVDVALERKPFFPDSDRVLSFVEQGQVEGYISGSTFSDLYYIIRRGKGRDSTLAFLRQLATFCQVATVDRAVISLALNPTFRRYLIGFFNQL